MQVISARVITVKAGPDTYFGMEIDQNDLKKLNIEDGDLLTLNVEVTKAAEQANDPGRN